MTPRVLDGLRGLAALYVVLFHANGLLWRVAADNEAISVLVQNALSFGHQAVLLFFLISGFCIHHAQARSGASSINTVAFAVRRLRRLYPPLLLGLVVTTVLDHIGMQLQPEYYTQPRNFFEGPVTVGSSYTLLTIIGNLMFQARLWVPELGSNSPLWSLAVEFWLYALYPLMLVGFRRVGPLRATLLIGLISATSWLALDWFPLWQVRVLSYWAIWAVGALIAEAHVRGTCPKLVTRLGPLAPLGIIGLAMLALNSADSEAVPDLWWGGVMAIGLAYVLLSPTDTATRFVQPICLACTRLGQISYSLYLVHYPVLALLAAGWLASHGEMPVGVELPVIGVSLGLGCGWLAWFAVERHCISKGASPSRATARSTARGTLSRACGRARPASISLATVAQTRRVLACSRRADRLPRVADDRLSRHTHRPAAATGLVAPS